MNNDVKEAIEDLKEEIAEKENHIRLLESIDFTKAVDEDIWHEICKTGLRYSDLLGVLVKNIFPLAKNIKVGCNYVDFEMMGFNVEIPTSYCRGINVDTSWYKRDSGEPKLEYNDAVKSMMKYFKAVENKAGWYECAKYKIRNGWNYRKWYLFLMWFFKYKWTDSRRDDFDKAVKMAEESHQKRLERYYAERKEMRKKAEKLINEVVPILDEFSTQHFCYNDQGYTIEEIKTFENI